ncbi:hypothetical protein CTAYLR_001410 [Chrysophaeum taylorii]|uniref:Saccharopine dehydrogenase NADP binding domain-containing protein n=1 Tax=Chrysophaeum taylorii TaxID=2483200 RepID=A0AAD7XLI4_9STRA|nr:hypothetical protein CTAYLR_001410 [Chrysophaeum taylorii]
MPDFNVEFDRAFTQGISKSARSFRWAVGGRDAAKVEALGEALAGSAAPPAAAVVASSEEGSVVAGSGRVVLSTAGPFSKYSDGIVAACASAGTSYVDINGEIPWVREVIDRDGDAAKRSGAVIVPNCGFDSVPSDLGAFLGFRRSSNLQGHFKMQGAMSGGTIATGILMAKEANDPAILGGIGIEDPVAPVAPTDARPYWLAPFGMASINTRVVRRSARLLDREVRYQEYVVAPSEMVAAKMAKSALTPPEKIQGMVDAGRLFKPSQGPDAKTRAESWFELTVVDAAENTPLVVVKGGDPGYDETAKMVSEAALALVLGDPLGACEGRGGVWTPATAFGDTLVSRLRAADMTIEEIPP